MPFIIIPIWRVVVIGVIVVGVITAAVSSKSESTPGVNTAKEVTKEVTKEVVCNAHKPKWWLLVTATSAAIGAIISILNVIVF